MRLCESFRLFCNLDYCFRILDKLLDIENFYLDMRNENCLFIWSFSVILYLICRIVNHIASIARKSKILASDASGFVFRKTGRYSWYQSIWLP